MYFIYHNGKVKDVETLDQMYMKKPQKQLVRLAFYSGRNIGVDDQTNEMVETDVSESSLVFSGTTTRIVRTWEIFKIFFDNNNIVPKWIEVCNNCLDWDVNVETWSCGPNFIEKVHCSHPVHYTPLHFFTRYPLPTTRMWNLLYIFDIPGYICFFTSLTLTVVIMKFYTYLG